MNRIAIFLLCAALTAPTLMRTQTASPHPPQRIQITTRLVAIFAELENQLFQAMQQKKSGDLDKLLDEDFQVWAPMIAGPTPRETWQPSAFARTPESFKIRQMAVRSITDDNAAVSFLVDESVQSAGQPAAEEYFVVDLWSKKTGHWLCTDRYVSPVAKASTAAGAEDKKPTGKQ